jgi:hypothetical protein
MAKKRNKKEIAKLRAQVEILRSQLSTSNNKFPKRDTVASNTEITNDNNFINGKVANSLVDVRDIRNSAFVSALFLSLIVLLYLTMAFWYPLIRF